MVRTRELRQAQRMLLLGALLLPVACGSDDEGNGVMQNPVTPGQTGGPGGAAAGTVTYDAGSAVAPQDAALPPNPGTGAIAGLGGLFGGDGGIRLPFDAGAFFGGLAGGGGGAGSDAALPMGPPAALGPDDGDPNKPVVSLPDVACGGPKGGFGLGQANLKIDDRDVIFTYPCNKHEGANVTFLLLLHGTNSDEATKAYIHGYFAAHPLANTSNLIIATPKSRASQWGNTTENPAASEDKPHLGHVIDYVYTNFGTKFNITSMWVGGHSWGAMYAKRFVCDQSIKEKARGVIGMSGGATAVGGLGFGTSGGDIMATTNCADYVSQIHTVGDMDMVTGLPDQTAAATKHGCKAKLPAVDLGKMQMMEEWPGCSPGWVHEGITMGAHTHTTSINPEVVKHIIDKIKATEKR
jgi:hypothetical protein